MPSGTLTNKNIDLLNRQEFVDKMIAVSGMLSENTKNACYAINGSWGVGKSFMLEMFEKTISDVGASMIFHFDCWKYDYYEEPLMAIVAVLLDSIDKQVHLLSTEKQIKIKGVLKVIGVKIAEKINEKIEEKTGIDPKDIWDVYSGVNEEAAKKIAETHAFDTYFDFNKILQKLRETITSMAQDQTVIFVVDELDRCLPEYTIKVLERLHHVFDEIPNVQVILSIDKEQLKHTIKQIYGEETSTEKYLAKFIDFEIKLDEGSLESIQNNRFAKYIALFDSDENAFELAEKLLDGIDMREKIAIIERCNLLHNIIYDKKPMSAAYMCMEIFLLLLYTYKINLPLSKQYFGRSGMFHTSLPNEKNPQQLPKGLSHFSEFFFNSKNQNMIDNYVFTYMNQTEVRTWDVYGFILAGYRYLLGFTSDQWDDSMKKNDMVYHVTQIWNLLKLIS